MGMVVVVPHNQDLRQGRRKTLGLPLALTGWAPVTPGLQPRPQHHPGISTWPRVLHRGQVVALLSYLLRHQPSSPRIPHTPTARQIKA